MSAFNVLGVLLLCAVIGSQADGFFDGFDILKQFNHEVDRFGADSRAHEHHVAHQLSSLFDTSGEREPLEGLEIEGHDQDDVEMPEIPGLPSGFLSGGGGGLFNMFGHSFGRQPWWKGPNVCVERVEVDESVHRNDTTPAVGHDNDEEDGAGGLFGAFEFSTCRQGATRYTCTTKIRSHGIKKTMTVKYQCCHGHKRVGSTPGCTRVDLKSLAETAVEVGAKDFIQLIKTANLEEKLSESNLTLFAPSDDALRDFSDSMQAANQVEFFVPAQRRRRSVQGMSMREIALGHIAQGVFDAADIDNEQIIVSDNSNSTLRMNVYPSSSERIITCNCARLIKSDNLADNGIVHVVDRVIRPITKTLAELVEQDEELTTLKSMLEKAGMMEMLKEPGHLTLFAPNDAAFKKLPASTMQRFMEGHACLKNVLTHHLIPHTLCSTAVESVATTVNQAGDVIHLERRLNGKVFIEDVEIIMKDVMATNGIIQVIEEVIVPDSAKTVSEVLASNNFTSFLSLLKEAKLVESLDAMENVTLFVPTDEALADPKVVSRLDSMRSSEANELRDLLLFHTTGPQKQSCDFSHDLALKTNMADQSIKINLYAMQPFFMGFRQMATAQCGRISRVDIRACGGVIHSVDRVLTAPKHNVLDQIYEDPKYSTLTAILRDSDLESTLKEKSPITFLAPTNEAFDAIDAKDMERFKTDKEFAAKVLKKHILPESVCCAGVQTTAWPFTSRVETMRGDSIAIRRDPNGGVHFGTTTVQHCDEMATNGVIHAVNRMMIPRSHGVSGDIQQRFGNPNVEVFLYGL